MGQWDYDGNATNDAGDLKCPGCPGTDFVGTECPLGTHQQRYCVTYIRANNIRIVAMTRNYFESIGGGMKSAAPGFTASQAAAIEGCDFRRSDCACLGKPATCLQAGFPAQVVCLTAGPDGGPCPGV